MVFARTDTGLLAQWWWTVDRGLLLLVAVLAVIGVMMVAAASPPVAEKNNLPAMHFVANHLRFMLPAALVLFIASLLSPTGVWRTGALVLAMALLLMVVVLAIGTPIKGAQRWIDLGPVNVQPSEFLKPSLAVVVAWLLARREDLAGAVPALALTAFAVALLIMQPDTGMAVTVAAVFALQVFLAGLPWIVMLLIAGVGVGLAVLAYSSLAHVRARIDTFLDPESGGDTYQIDRAIEAIQAGGLFGKGPGEGVVKYLLPDAHSDFIYAVVIEEFGVAIALFILVLFAWLFWRALSRLDEVADRFTLLAGAGLIGHFILQVMINIGVNLHVLPTKGTTLPFISYGGSALTGMALTMGWLLALTRRRPVVEWLE
ncbi:MAG: FtsW/RodA/SpoVE family cell cycle protein [Geminicoccaceae bacterium]